MVKTAPPVRGCRFTPIGELGSQEPAARGDQTHETEQHCNQFDEDLKRVHINKTKNTEKKKKKTLSPVLQQTGAAPPAQGGGKQAPRGQLSPTTAAAASQGSVVTFHSGR